MKWVYCRSGVRVSYVCVLILSWINFFFWRSYIFIRDFCFLKEEVVGIEINEVNDRKGIF